MLRILSPLTRRRRPCAPCSQEVRTQTRARGRDKGTNGRGCRNARAPRLPPRAVPRIRLTMLTHLDGFGPLRALPLAVPKIHSSHKCSLNFDRCAVESSLAHPQGALGFYASRARARAAGLRIERSKEVAAVKGRSGCRGNNPSGSQARPCPPCGAQNYLFASLT